MEWYSHRGSDPRNSPYIVMWLKTEREGDLRGYGKRLWRLPESALIDVPEWVYRFARRYYLDEGVSPHELTNELLSEMLEPETVMDGAGVWDNVEFVEALWRLNMWRFEDMHDRGIFGFRIGDGAMTYSWPDIPAVEIEEEE